MLICVYLLKLVTTELKLLSLSSKSECNYSLHLDQDQDQDGPSERSPEIYP